ncbi:MAG: hypothetical protein EON95_00190 [Caulobacteraceae bacterium]|nr:hypothetical protein [Caulobacter sp.]RYF95737.1 MAG: hypothetical protein EON95_00190 [Caulobacteraceae bacterium]
MSLSIKSSIGLAALQIGVALAASLASHRGWISNDMATRVTMATIGLGLVIVANAIPKGHDGRTALGQSIKRATGWAMFLGGLAYGAIWLFAPMTIAALASCAAVIAALAWTLVFSWRRWRRSQAG